MVEEKKLLYILVEDEEGELGQTGAGGKAASHRYTRPMLQSTLQFMGCRPRHAFKVSTYMYFSNNKFTVISYPKNCNGEIRFQFHLLLWLLVLQTLRNCC